MMLIAKAFSVLGATRTHEFVAEVKRKVNEDGNKFYPTDHRQHHQQGPGLQFVQEEAQDDLDGGDQGVQEGQTDGLLRFFSDEIFFSQDQNSNRQDDRWICQNVDEVPVVKHTKFHSSVMVLGVISSEGDKGLKVNTAIYIDVMKNIALCLPAGLSFRPQVEGDPARTCGPHSPDCNPLDYFFWGMVENKTNKHAHNTLDTLRAAIVEEFVNMKKDVVAKAYVRFSHRLEMVRRY
ncbi:Transposable element tcb2 transposase [Caligus rogercresseyi]|uniref:Transposable element tcb2 transposase n=1 Tax=Caligus rogercresseyi TaxID=217165 RepID=A0A7T8KGM9_CALRO|nr:Transposable element tcb2 transposase [Caligus rogercresseyi]